MNVAIIAGAVLVGGLADFLISLVRLSGKILVNTRSLLFMNIAVPVFSPDKNVSIYNATLEERIDITSQLVIFRVRPDCLDFSFKAGQFTVLGLKRAASRIPEADPEEVIPEKAEKLLRRAYSVSSNSQEKKYVEFYISLVTSGELTPRLFHLQPGDRLFMGESAKGMFTLENVPTEKNILLVGTGTGLAPYVSMVRSASLGFDTPIRSIAILHGASYSWDLGYRGELESLAQRCARFRYIPIITKPNVDKDWRGRVGRLNEWLAERQLEAMCGFSLELEKTHVFLCGHPDMVRESAVFLQGMGYNEGNRKQPGNLHLEKYW